jgi:hypothetical protein
MRDLDPGLESLHTWADAIRAEARAILPDVLAVVRGSPAAGCRCRCPNRDHSRAGPGMPCASGRRRHRRPTGIHARAGEKMDHRCPRPPQCSLGRDAMNEEENTTEKAPTDRWQSVRCPQCAGVPIRETGHDDAEIVALMKAWGIPEKLYGATA